MCKCNSGYYLQADGKTCATNPTGIYNDNYIFLPLYVCFRKENSSSIYILATIISMTLSFGIQIATTLLTHNMTAVE